MFFKLLYQISINLIWVFAHLAAWFSPKTRKFIQSRRANPAELPGYRSGPEKLVWMHCASLGEFEQGKPLIIEIKKQFPATKILLSFFSPSGFERVQTGEVVDHKVYLPIDRSGNAREFLNRYKPDLAIFVKYDYWYNFLRTLNGLSIPTTFISVVIHNNHFILKPFAVPILNELRKIHRIFVQDEASSEVLKSKGFENSIRAGDTRIDSVAALPAFEFNDELILHFCRPGKPLIIAGSCWKKDIDLFKQMDPEIIRSYRWIIAPHETSESLLAYIEKSFLPLRPTRYSAGEPEGHDVMIIDTIGILKYLYRFARIVYIGGGFGAGIHNTLEPAAYAKPVFFGPNYRKFVEARELVRQGAFYCVRNAVQFTQQLKGMESDEKYEEAATKIKNYIEDNRHATRVIINDLERFL
jgi:3-deoxy-D-manno-octulosonic-acid transferase